MNAIKNQMSNQCIILHLSDIHFGSGHIFLPDGTTSGEPANESVPNLLQSIKNDIRQMGQSYSSVLLMVTGDLTQSGSDDQFLLVKQFLEGLEGNETLGCKITKDNIFLVPGNHDVRYDQDGHELFWKGYYNFYRDYFGETIGRELSRPEEERFCRVHDFAKDRGFIVLELNTCHHNRKDSIDQHRGFLDQNDIVAVKSELKKIDSADARKAIKIALLHHHPVLIPAFAESGRNYDAVINSGHLLKLLNEFGFQLILHGHKHNPHSFVYDATCGWHTIDSSPMFVVAGGSAGSPELPPGGGNSYNLINVRHNFESNLTRIQITTRGLHTRDEANQLLLRSEWNWKTIKNIDKVLATNTDWTYGAVIDRDFGDEDTEREKLRKEEYARLRLNMPVVEVVPSLKENQEFEARMKIVGHPYREELPTMVVWSAGSLFSVRTCLRGENPEFKNTFSYYGPMLVQVSMTFEDGTVEHSYIYAHVKK